MKNVSFVADLNTHFHVAAAWAESRELCFNTGLNVGFEEGIRINIEFTF